MIMIIQKPHPAASRLFTNRATRQWKHRRYPSSNDSPRHASCGLLDLIAYTISTFADVISYAVGRSCRKTLIDLEAHLTFTAWSVTLLDEIWFSKIRVVGVLLW